MSTIASNTYVRQAFNQDALVRNARRLLAGVNFDTFVGTGISGTVAVPVLARSLRKHFAIVRKGDDNSTHSSSRVEGVLGNRWIFVDDLVCGGTTRNNCIDAIAAWINEEHEHAINRRQEAIYALERWGSIPSWLNVPKGNPEPVKHVTEYLGTYLYGTCDCKLPDNECGCHASWETWDI